MRWFSVHFKAKEMRNIGIGNMQSSCLEEKNILIQANKMIIEKDRTILIRNGKPVASIPVSVLAFETEPPIDLQNTGK
ncbi:hypothetical protein ETU09_05815 [Apibacter muscae]|uniref:Uncharacterized protein n=1 Tax=Apibacter muscae TaxID=2509004 RepID=A0A563DE21_9FLAO|nr:hypothetical protein [Apibacter muscae]TWP28440.1 hypothetical protein ETU09_05815 [Apibacter muscae]